LINRRRRRGGYLDWEITMGSGEIELGGFTPSTFPHSIPYHNIPLPDGCREDREREANEGAGPDMYV